MDEFLIRLAQVDELGRLLRQEKVVLELLEVMAFNFDWLNRFCERNEISIPDKERVANSQRRIQMLIAEMASDESKHRHDFGESDGEVTAPRR